MKILCYTLMGLMFLASCACSFKGEFLKIDEFRFGPIPHEEEKAPT